MSSQIEIVAILLANYCKQIADCSLINCKLISEGSAIGCSLFSKHITPNPSFLSWRWVGPLLCAWWLCFSNILQIAIAFVDNIYAHGITQNDNTNLCVNNSKFLLMQATGRKITDVISSCTFVRAKQQIDQYGWPGQWLYIGVKSFVR